MAEKMLTEQDVWDGLRDVMDPEIPVLSLVDLGVIREVEFAEDGVTVTMTPTFSGCPALLEMENLIREKLLSLGASRVTVEKVLSPPWTSDWISDHGRAQLKAFGLQPPARHGGNLVTTFFDIVSCPRCDSPNTTLKNSFGSTLCRAIWQCNACQETFEQMKAL